MKISFEKIRDSYSMKVIGYKFYDGMTEIHPEDIVKRLDSLSKLEKTPALSNVMGCLQEKKKLWEERQSKWMDEEKSLTDDTDFDDERLILIESINLSERIINDLEEIINKNSP